MDFNDVGNDILRHGKWTVSPCARCVSFWANGKTEFLAQCGCLMPDPPTAAETQLYSYWVSKQPDGSSLPFMKCYRCHILNQECVAIPSEYSGRLDRMSAILKEIRDKECDGMIPNPLYNPLAEDEEANAPEKIPGRIKVEGEVLELRLGRLMTLCQPIAKELSSVKYAPHSRKLFLHSGAILPADDPDSEVRPDGRARDNKSIAIKNEVAKRKYDIAVSSEVDNVTSPPAAGPRKRRVVEDAEVVDGPRVVLQKKKDEISSKMADLVTERERLPSKKRGAVTKRLNVLRRQLEALSE